MPQKLLLKAIKTEYLVTDLGEVFRNGKKIKPYPNDQGHLFVRIYFCGYRKAIAVHRLVWMKQTNRTIPKDFEVHHINRITSDNRWINLLCVHKEDHRKLHQEDVDDVPF